MVRRTAAASLTTSYPSMVARPESACSRVASTLTAVVLPAPLGPSTPRTVPSVTPKSTPSRACVVPNRFFKPSASMM